MSLNNSMNSVLRQSNSLNDSILSKYSNYNSSIYERYQYLEDKIASYILSQRQNKVKMLDEVNQLMTLRVGHESSFKNEEARLMHRYQLQKDIKEQLLQQELTKLETQKNQLQQEEMAFRMKKYLKHEATQDSQEQEIFYISEAKDLMKLIGQNDILQAQNHQMQEKLPLDFKDSSIGNKIQQKNRQKQRLSSNLTELKESPLPQKVDLVQLQEENRKIKQEISQICSNCQYFPNQTTEDLEDRIDQQEEQKALFMEQFQNKITKISTLKKENKKMKKLLESS